jgi:hypothetical protein
VLGTAELPFASGVSQAVEQAAGERRFSGPANCVSHKQPPEQVFDDPFLSALASCRAMLRMQNVGFLGAIDYLRHGNGPAPHRRRHTRYEHSVGVSTLAIIYGRVRELSQRERRVIAAAGLVHDIGHGPLSHTLEPVFREAFGIDHHTAGYNILKGNSPFEAYCVVPGSSIFSSGGTVTD